MKRLTRLPQLRIAANARCGRACFYCRPSGEALPTAAKQELTAEQVVRACRAAVTLGVRDVKLTGGDPALWGPLVDCVYQLKHEVNVPQLHVISRHPTLGDRAEQLSAAGVDLLNISLDTLDPDLHRDITGQADLDLLLDAIHRCSQAGVPCKINMVVMEGINDGEIDALIEFCEDAKIRSLKLLDVIRDLEDGAETYANRLEKLRGRRPSDTYMSLAAVVERLRSQAAEVRTIHQAGLGHPMTSMRLNSGLEVVVKDHQTGAWYGDVCNGCPHFKCHDALMALRLTADARLQFCLLREDSAINLVPTLGKGDGELHAVMHRALSVYDTATFCRDQGAAAPHGRPLVRGVRERLLTVLPS